MAQYDINPKLGYYYWDMVGIQGQETIATGTDKTKTETREYNVTRLEYLYDFCGKANFFLGFAGSKGRLSAAAGEHDNDYETNTAEIFIGPYFKVGDYADAMCALARLFLRVISWISGGRNTRSAPCWNWASALASASGAIWS